MSALLRLLALAVIALFPAVWVSNAHADVSLLVEEPFGGFGAMNPTGHAAIYLNRVCAETPTQLRLCEPGETGVVISRYHHIGGYDWLAMPILPYLYAVDRPEDVPATATPEIEAGLRNSYRRSHLQDLAPDQPDGSAPRGEWYQLVGSSYDRTIYGFTAATTMEQDEQLLARFNDRRNVSHFNLFFNNCADLSRTILDFYFPHAVRRSFLADFGFTTPKHTAERLTHYGKRHETLEFRTFVIPQVPGSIPRSTHVRGVAESLVKSKKYLLPLVVWHPEFTAGLAVAYLTRGRFAMPSDAVRLTAADFVAPLPVVRPEGVAVDAVPGGAAAATSDVSAPAEESERTLTGGGMDYLEVTRFPSMEGTPAPDDQPR